MMKPSALKALFTINSTWVLILRELPRSLTFSALGMMTPLAALYSKITGFSLFVTVSILDLAAFDDRLF